MMRPCPKAASKATATPHPPSRNAPLPMHILQAHWCPQATSGSLSNLQQSIRMLHPHAPRETNAHHAANGSSIPSPTTPKTDHLPKKTLPKKPKTRADATRPPILETPQTTQSHQSHSTTQTGDSPGSAGRPKPHLSTATPMRKQVLPQTPMAPNRAIP